MSATISDAYINACDAPHGSDAQALHFVKLA